MSSSHKRSYGSPLEARRQAAELLGFLDSTFVQVGDESVEIPCRGLFTDEQSEAVNELELEAETWDREPDIVIRDDDGNETARRQGDLKRPYRKNGKLVKPQYPVRLAQAIFGKEEYERLHKLGLEATTVTAHLNAMDLRLTERAETDPKSVGSDGDAVPVSDADRS